MSSRLAVLPLLQIKSVERLQDGRAVIKGRLEHCDLANDGPRWFWLIPSEKEFVVPSIIALDESTGDVTIEIDAEEYRDYFLPGTTVYWLTPYWQAYHVPMILFGQWSEVRYVPTDAKHFVLANLHGWAPVGDSIPEGAMETSIEKNGWNHEHCEICNGRIGAKGSPIGYQDEDQHWLCPACYRKWAEPRSLGFLVGEV